MGDKFRVQVNKGTAVHFHFYLIYIVPNRFHTKEAPSGITKTHYSEIEWLHGNQYLNLFKTDIQQKKTSQTHSTSSISGYRQFGKTIIDFKPRKLILPN